MLNENNVLHCMYYVHHRNFQFILINYDSKEEDISLALGHRKTKTFKRRFALREKNYGKY